MSRRLLTFTLIALAALAVGACGNKEKVTLHGTTEGIYIDVGDLKYQVQISRLLNPTDREDSGYLVDLPADQQLGPKENWFAVFMRVENTSDKAEPATNGYSIRDTQGNIYRPIAMGPKNVFVYRPVVLQPKDILPYPTARRARTRSRARCSSSRSRSPTSRTAPWSSGSRRPTAAARRAPSTSTCSSGSPRPPRARVGLCGAYCRIEGRVSPRW